MEQLYIIPYQGVQPTIPVLVDIGWMEIQQELASLMGHGVAMLLPAHVCE